MMANTKYWMVRAGERGYLIDEFISNELIAIGWNDIGRLNHNLSYNELKDLLKNTYPEDSEGRINQTAGQIWRFLQEFKIGDKVVTYNTWERIYHLGTIISDYQYSEILEYHHCRSVDWQNGTTDRDALSADTKNTLGAISTIFSLSEDIWKELEENNDAYLSESAIKEVEEMHASFIDDELREIKDDIISKSSEFIKDAISQLTWQDTETLVGGLFKSMGYRIRMTPKGGDLGSDILASPDELGMEEPRIRIEVKKRTKDRIGAEVIRSFIGGMRGHHKGVFVTTSGFSKEAEYEAQRANFQITLIDANWLVELIINNYETLEPEIKALVPLKKIYWPV